MDRIVSFVDTVLFWELQFLLRRRRENEMEKKMLIEFMVQLCKFNGIFIGNNF